jgi:hypothetical protein
MSRALSVISVLAMLSGGCGYSRIASARLAAPQSAAEPASITETHLRRECAVTQSIRDQPPKDPNADPFPLGPWYINADRTIWAGWDAASCVSGQKGNKVLWIRPQGTQLRVTGRRLDADAPPLKVTIPCCYPTGFQASGLFFPTPGCWEVTAKAGSSELKFVTKVK